VLATKALKPFTTMNFFLSDNNVGSYYVPCTMLTISGVTGKFVGNESQLMNDNQTLRTTNNYNSQRNGFNEPLTWFGYQGAVNPEYLNYYDTIGYGEIVTATVAGVVKGTAVVVADETIYDKVSNTNKRILYVINIKGTFTDAIISGFTSGAKATVTAVSAGNKDTNSLGNLYGAIVLPSGVFESGTHKVLVTDNQSSNISAAVTYAYSSYETKGLTKTFTNNVNYDTQAVATVTTNVHTRVTY